MADIAGQVVEVIAQTVSKSKVHSLSSESSIQSLDLDSIDVMELTMELEGRFSIELDPVDLEECATIGDLVKLINASLQK